MFVGLAFILVIANWSSHAPSASESPGSFAVSTLASLAMFYFGLLPVAFNKQYTGFSFQLEPA